MKTIISGLVIMGTTYMAHANTDIAPDTRCRPIEKMKDFVDKAKNAPPEETDSVTMQISLFVAPNEGLSIPEQIYLLDDGVRTDLVLDDDGKIKNLDSFNATSQSAQMCMTDPALVDLPDDAKVAEFSVGTSVNFQNRNGYHALPEIIDGLKDGRQHYKRLVPGMMSVMVPKMTHIIIFTVEEWDDNDLQIWANESRVTDIPIESVGDLQFVEARALERAGVSHINVTNETYVLSPGPSPKTYKRLFSE